MSLRNRRGRRGMLHSLVLSDVRGGAANSLTRRAMSTGVRGNCLLALNVRPRDVPAARAALGVSVAAGDNRDLGRRRAQAPTRAGAQIADNASGVGQASELSRKNGPMAVRAIATVAAVDGAEAKILPFNQAGIASLNAVNAAVNQMDQVTPQNGLRGEESTAAIRSFAREAEALVRLISTPRNGQSAPQGREAF